MQDDSPATLSTNHRTSQNNAGSLQLWQSFSLKEVELLLCFYYAKYLLSYFFCISETEITSALCVEFASAERTQLLRVPAPSPHAVHPPWNKSFGPCQDEVMGIITKLFLWLCRDTGHSDCQHAAWPIVLSEFTVKSHWWIMNTLSLLKICAAQNHH